MRTVPGFAVVLVSVGLASLVVPSLALGQVMFSQVISIDDRTESLSVSSTGFPIQFQPDNDPANEYLHFTVATLTPAASNGGWSKDLTGVGPAEFDRLLVLITQGSNILDVRFGSDPSGPAQVPRGAYTFPAIPEDGTFQHMFDYTVGGAGGTCTLNGGPNAETVFKVASDVDIPVS
jgi:hypothetical protein